MLIDRKLLILSDSIGYCMKTTVILQERGLVSIPKAVRKALKLKKGDFLEMDITKVDIEKVD